MIRSRWSRRLLALALCLHLAAAAALSVPGHISVDELGYDLMASSLASGHGMHLQNDPLDAPSPELELQNSRTTFYSRGRLVSKYPYGASYLAAPLYRLVGYRALFLLNTLALAAAMLATWLLGRHFLRDERYALAACLILAPGTYAWEYAAAAWPHALALAASTGGAWAALRALALPTGRQRLRSAALAGFLLSAGLSFRLDTLMIAGLLGLALLLPTPARWRELLVMLAAGAPIAAWMTWTNFERFGTLSLLTYGNPEQLSVEKLGNNLPLLAAGVLAVALRIGWARIPRSWISWRLAGLLSALCLLAALSVPELSARLRHLAGGWYALLIDLRTLTYKGYPASARGPGGGLLYLGYYKKALLQSAPFLAALLLPAVRAVRGDRSARALWPAWLAPLALPVVFGNYNWHGGLCWNMRYFLPILPFAAVLTAWTLREALRAAPRGWRRLAAGGLVLSAGCAALLVYPSAGDIAQAERRLLVIPLALAAATAAASSAAAVDRWRARAAGPLLVLTAAGLGWSAAIGLLYDLRASREVRGQSVELAASLDPLLEPGDLMLVTFEPPFGGLIERRVNIAIPRNDQGADLRRLVLAHLGRGQAVFSALSEEEWGFVLAQGSLEGLVVRPVGSGPGFTLRRIAEPQ